MSKLLREVIEEVRKRPCQCVICAECRGTGRIRDRCDDLAELDPCDSCYGGIVATCQRCQEMEELYEALDEEKALGEYMEGR